MKKIATKGKGNSFSIWLGTAALLAVFFLFSGVHFVLEIDETASRIYDHSYLVSNEAQAMRSRLLDMKMFLEKVLLDRETPSDDFFDQRYSLHEESLELIEKRYLGPSEDLDRLQEAFGALRKAQADATRYESGHTAIETRGYIQSVVYPKYDEVNACLDVILDFVDANVKNLEAEISAMAQRAVLSFGAILVLVVGIFWRFWRREENATREIRYREMLFNRLCANIDDVFYIYNREEERMEFVSSNEERMLGFSLSQGIKTQEGLACIPPKDREELLALAGGGIVASPRDVSFHILSGGQSRRMKMRIYPEARGKRWCATSSR